MQKSQRPGAPPLGLRQLENYRTPELCGVGGATLVLEEHSLTSFPNSPLVPSVSQLGSDKVCFMSGLGI